MVQSRRFVLALLVGFSLSFASLIVDAKSQSQKRGEDSDVEQSVVQDDKDLVRAVDDRRNVHFLEAGNLVVTKLMPDDTQGRPHQKWYVRLSNGKQVFCVYNLDMGKRVPIKVGSVMSVGGEFKWTQQGALVHWLHHDPRDRRPDGYVEVDGVRYGDE